MNDSLAVILAAHDREIQALREMYDCHTRMLDTLEGAVRALTETLAELARFAKDWDRL